MTAQENHQEKRQRMRELLKRAQSRLGSKWLNAWLSYFYGLMESRQIVSDETLNALEFTLKAYIKMQGVAPKGNPELEKMTDEKTQGE